MKKVFLQISQNSQGNSCARVSFLIKLQAAPQVFSCEFCEMFKNTSERLLLTVRNVVNCIVIYWKPVIRMF